MKYLIRSRNFPLLVATLLFVVSLQAQTYTDLYELDDAHGCCALYSGLLAQGRDGNLYGGTFGQGKFGFGTVFKVTLAGGLTTLYDFDSSDGNGAQGGLSMGLDGNFYGTTYQGGAHTAGTIFQITPSGSLTTLYSFGNANDGAYPRVPPAPAPDGNLYGVTGNGTVAVVYRITPGGSFTVLATLPSQSETPLYLGNDGLLYGMTPYGGNFNDGTFFSVSTKGALKIIYSFDSPTGSQPYGSLLQASDGNFYGTASDGGTATGGVVFKLTPSGTYSVLHNFDSTDHVSGSTPQAGLVQGSDGFLYGATTAGGAFGAGVMFRLKTNGSGFSVISTFDGTHGSSPSPTPVLDTNGVIYGLTHAGGLSDDGVFYSMNAGLQPFASLFVISSGKIGTTVQILGQGFTGTKSVSFNGTKATFTVVSDNFLTAKVPAGATTGTVTVAETSATLTTPQNFRVMPQVLSFSPPSGPVGTVVTITGKSFTQTQGVGFGDRIPAQFTVNSDSQITATVPSGAITGPVGVQTKGGTALSSTSFTVTK